MSWLKRLRSAGILAVVLAIALIGLVRNAMGREALGSARAGSSTPTTSGEDGHRGPGKGVHPVPPAAGMTLRTLRIPPEFADFESYPPGRQLDAVTDLGRNAHLPPAMRDFLVDLASDPARAPVLRNNAANALGIQMPPVPGWPDRLAAQVVDPAETAIWRDYALQHLADHLIRREDAAAAGGDFTGSPADEPERRRHLAVLIEAAASSSRIAGTALLHLDRLSREPGSDLDPRRFRDLLLRVVEGGQAEVGARVTAFGILALRGDPADAAIARRFLADRDPDTRRAAMSALGHLGDREDLPAIEAVETSGDRTLELAKAAACARLRARGPPPHGMGGLQIP